MNRKERRAARGSGRPRQDRPKGPAAATPSGPADGILRQAVAHHQAGRLREAESLYRQALQVVPEHPDGLYFLGMLHVQAGRPSAAIDPLQRAVTLRPGNAQAQAQLGTLLMDARRHKEAEQPLRAAVRAMPGEVPVALNLALCLCRQGRPAEGEEIARRVLARNKADARAWQMLGTALHDQRKLAAAEAALTRALGIAPDNAMALHSLGMVLDAQGRLTGAIDAYERSLSLRPGHANTQGNLGVALVNAGRVEDGIAAYRAALDGAPDDMLHRSNLLMALNYRDLPAQEVADEHGRIAGALAPDPPMPPATPDATPDRRLTLAILSGDLRRHSVAFFLEPLLGALDRTAFRVVAFANVARPDAVTARIRARCDHWVDTTALDDFALAQAIRDEGADIALDLSGHTRGNRLGALARGPAPLQGTWLGYPNTTGLDAIDFRLVDPVTDPTGPADTLHTERLIRIDPPFLCYGGPEDPIEVTPLPSGADGPITFASFNNWSKVGPETLDAWAAVLERVPGSQLLLKARPLADPVIAAECRNAFATRGIDPDRVEAIGWTVEAGDHVALYDRVDIALDTFPYNGTTTTCEALWMGVPVVTIAGDRHAARVGASLLGAVRLGHLAAPDLDRFAAAAAALAADRSALADLRAGLRGRMQASPLCDADGFARRFERALRQLWRERCAANGAS